MACRGTGNRKFVDSPRNRPDRLHRPAKGKSRIDRKHRLEVVKRCCRTLDSRSFRAVRRKVCPLICDNFMGNESIGRASVPRALVATIDWKDRNRLSTSLEQQLCNKTAHVSTKAAWRIDVKWPNGLWKSSKRKGRFPV